MTTDLIQIQTTVADRTTGERIAEELLERRLAACVQISSPVISCYRWEGELHRDEELVLVAKTLSQAWDDVCRLIAEIHPYDEPQLIALPMVFASSGYAKWVRDQVKADR